MIRFRLLAAVVAALLFSPSLASAHFLWLVTEPAGSPTKVKVYFGEAAEPDDPELLEKVVKAEVWTFGGRRGEPQVLSLKKGENALEAELAGGSQSAVILRHTYGVVSRGGDSFLLKYYAKTYPSPLPGSWKSVKDEERLPLEIVPKTEGKATALRVTWQGKAAAGDTVTITGPGMDKKFEAATDGDGFVRCELPAAGLYSIRVRHVEETTGEFEGQAYKGVRHYSTLALSHLPATLSPLPNKLPDVSKGVTSFGGAVSGDALYVYGGNYGSAHDYSNEDQSGDLWKLDLKNPGKWEQLTGGTRLQGLALIEYKGKLYRVGGFAAMNKTGEKQDLRSQAEFARFDIAKGAWETLPSLPEPRSSHDAALIGDTLYVAGGWHLQGAGGNSKWHDTALSINLATDKLEWKTIAAPPAKRRALALAEWQGKLYCIGGMQEEGGPTTAVAVYDPTSNAWTNGPALLGTGMDGFGCSAFACQGTLYVTTISGSIQCLKGEGKAWEFAGQLAHPRFFHRLLPWRNEQLVVVGGGSMTVGKVMSLELLSPGEITTAAK